MKENRHKKRSERISLLLSMILIFCILGSILFLVSRKISREMSSAAIQNLNENLDLIKCTIEAMWNKEAEFQKLMAQDIAGMEDLEEYIRSYQKNDTMVKVSLIRTGETRGISNTGEAFTEKGMDFTQSEQWKGFEISHSYLNYMGTWAYTIKSPVVRDGR